MRLWRYFISPGKSSGGLVTPSGAAVMTFTVPAHLQQDIEEIAAMCASAPLLFQTLVAIKKKALRNGQYDIAQMVDDGLTQRVAA